MVSPQILEYIQKQLADGQKPEEIKAHLLQMGINDVVALEALSIALNPIKQDVFNDAQLPSGDVATRPEKWQVAPLPEEKEVEAKKTEPVPPLVIAPPQQPYYQQSEQAEPILTPRAKPIKKSSGALDNLLLAAMAFIALLIIISLTYFIIIRLK